MALKKEIVTAFGFTANYWKLSRIVYLKYEKSMSGTLELFLSNETAKISNIALEEREIVFNVESDGLTKDCRVLCYERAKKTEAFSDAEDC